jgi:hypothetical protein
MHGRTFPTVFVFAFLVCGVAPACSGASDPYDLLGTGGGTPPADAGKDTSTHVGTPDSGSGQQPDSSTAIDSGSVEDSSIGLPDSGEGPDTGPPPTTEFTCPPTTCKEPQVCCATGEGQGETATYKCQTAGKTCQDTSGNAGTPISCASAANCPGEICCGDNNGNSFYNKVSCEPTCTGTSSTGGTNVVFCDPNGNDCPTGTTCQASQILQGFSVCNP